jgi:hypothetical protein
MPLIIGNNGITWDNGGNRRDFSVPFFRRDSSNVNYTVGTGVVTGFTTVDWSIPKKSEFLIHYHMPFRNDSLSWGGLHTRSFYRINSGAYIYCGENGYTTAMGSARSMISGQDITQVFDFKTSLNDFTFGMRFDYRTYDSSGLTGGSHNLEAAANTTYHGAVVPWRHYITLTGWSFQ